MSAEVASETSLLLLSFWTAWDAGRTGDLGGRAQVGERGEGWNVSLGWFSFSAADGKYFAPIGDGGGVCRDWKNEAGTVVGLLASGAERVVGDGDGLGAWVAPSTCGGKFLPTEVGDEAKLVLIGEDAAGGIAE